ncbi:MAG: hypothetical protein IT330_18580 [Anaerolineae bacterium]|nr:hypothetical protein [Anaerolineae bacterium]
MKNARIFLVGSSEDSLLPMVETAYPREDTLQTLLARYPDLLPGDQIDPEDPRRWLLVAREMGVPGDVTETGRWSLDHLFLDQDGIPTFVECKRASDTRGRREVVAQMLDYAANGIEYWGMDRLRQAATETTQKRGKSLDAEILQLIDSQDETEVEAYWKKVESNLRTGKVRLVFVADDTARELRRLVEFLNEKMADVEVLAVEVKQFLGKGQTAIVPRVVGLTEAARERKGTEPSTAGHTTREDFLAKCSPGTVSVFEKVLDLAVQKGHTIYWGTKGFSVRAYLPRTDRFASFVYGWPPGFFEFYFGHLPLSAEESVVLRKDLMAFGVFRAAGEKTLRATLEGATLAHIPEVYDFILAKIDEIVQAH